MPLTNVGRNFIAAAIIDDGPPTFFTNANARIGVGDSGASATPSDIAGQTDLQGSNKARVGMESTYPQIATNALTFRSEYGTAVGNFDWEEWGVFNAASEGVMLNRKVESLGTKAAGSTWVLTVTVTVTLG